MSFFQLPVSQNLFWVCQKKQKTDWLKKSYIKTNSSFCHTIHSILSFQPNVQSCKYYKYVPFVFIQASHSNPILIAIPLNYDLFCLRLCYQQTPDTWYLPRSVPHPSRVINCECLWELSGWGSRQKPGLSFRWSHVNCFVQVKRQAPVLQVSSFLTHFKSTSVSARVLSPH